jgi:hypothetical protein
MELGKEKKFMVDFLFVITLFFVFALSALMLVMIGANVYKNTVNNMSVNFNNRTAFAYLTEKIRQNDSYDLVTTGEYKGLDALVLTEIIDNTNYCTYIYLYDGHIKELFIKLGADIDPSAGQDILEAKDFSVSNVNDSLYKISIVTSDDVTIPLLVSTHSQ